MIVLVIIAVTVAVVLPSVRSGLQQREVRRSVRQFISAVRVSSARSIADRTRVGLTVWPDDARFAVEGQQSPYELPEFGVFDEIDGGREGEDEEIIFDFYPTGSSSGGSVQMEFETRGGFQSYTFTINPLLSSVSIESGS